ncbi:MAG: hypothetical protein KF729_07745 [Sandaracinaceae bacterium]|nr:hypothetical protein [Sandaracinaceae bacterium]
MKNPKRARALRLAAAAALLIATCACGSSGGTDDPPPPPPPPPVAPVAPAPEIAPTGAPTGMPAPGTTSLINLSSGFLPDPHTVSGNAGGPLAASTLDPSCRGNIPNVPQHTLMLGSDFRSLSIMAHSEGDTTLVIRTPDGTYRCDDDSGDNFDPRLTGAWAPGTYQIWVGVFAGSGAPYTLGLTEFAHVTSSSLPL